MKLRGLSLLSICCALIAVTLRAQFHNAESASKVERAAELSRTPLQYRRAMDATFLTIPEWYLVWSPEEYANFMAEKPPSEFPYLGHTRQFWQGYGVANDATKDD